MWSCLYILRLHHERHACFSVCSRQNYTLIHTETRRLSSNTPDRKLLKHVLSIIVNLFIHFNKYLYWFKVNAFRIVVMYYAHPLTEEEEFVYILTSVMRDLRKLALCRRGSCTSPSQKDTIPWGKLCCESQATTRCFCMSGRPVTYTIR